MRKKHGSSPIVTVLTIVFSVVILFVISLVFTIFSMGLTICTVQGSSMEPTIMDGTTLLLNPQKEMEHFDIAVFREDDSYIIKRVVGLPGDTITVLDGNLFINGQPYEEPYVTEEYSQEFAKESFKKVVPEGSYFVLGDNRDHSVDSRETDVVPEEDLVGVAILTIKEG